MAHRNTTSANNVLVLGDWYVDAHWVVAPHESETASRTGQEHSRAIHDLNATVRVLCGAGQVASILNQGFQDRIVYGLGSWANGDDALIQGLVDGNNQGDNPHSLSSKIIAAKDRVASLISRAQMDREQIA